MVWYRYEMRLGYVLSFDFVAIESHQHWPSSLVGPSWEASKGHSCQNTCLLRPRALPPAEDVDVDAVPERSIAVSPSCRSRGGDMGCYGEVSESSA